MKHWTWWARVDGKVLEANERFFPDFERSSKEIQVLVDALGAPKGPAATETEVWARVGLVWRWWRKHVRVNNAAYGAVNRTREGWPGFAHFAAYYKQHEGLVCAVCFSKTHLFACLLGRILYPRDRIAIASAHHTMNGAPPTASHVYVAVYVGERWHYFDPTYAAQHKWPTFDDRRSLGTPQATSVDYEHPFKVLPLPGSTLSKVPMLGTPWPARQSSGGARYAHPVFNQLFVIFTLIVALVWLIRLIYLVGQRRWFSAAFLAFALVWSLNALFALSEFRTSTVTRDGVVRNPRVEFLYLLGLLLLPFIARHKLAAVMLAHRLMLFLCLAWGYRFAVDGFARIGDHTFTLALILAGHLMLTVVVYQPLSKRKQRQAQETQEALEATFD